MPQYHKPQALPFSPPTDFPDPEDSIAAGTRGFTPEALRLLLACSRQITMGLAHALSKLWRKGDPVQAGFAERMLVQVEFEKQRAVNEIQRARLERFPARQRRHYTPEERFRIVVLMHAYGLGRRETVRRYRRAPRPTGSDSAKPRVLRARYVNHIWTADLTEIRGFLGLFTYKLVVVLDLFSRFPWPSGSSGKSPQRIRCLGCLTRP